MSIIKNAKNLKCDWLEGGILQVAINRPEKFNALNKEVLLELKEVLSELKSNSTVRGMLLTGEGDKAFIAGADIKAMNAMNADEAHAFGQLGQDVSKTLESMPFPVVAAVHGFALGGGCEMAMACDFIFCTKDAVFGQPEVKLGLIPGFGGTQRLAKLVGGNRAKEIIFSGRNVSAQEALNIGLAVKLFPTKQEMIAACLEFFNLSSQNGPLAIALSKEVVNNGIDLPILNGLGLELESFSKVFNSEDMKEGTKAFLEKRKAQFKGK